MNLIEIPIEVKLRFHCSCVFHGKNSVPHTRLENMYKVWDHHHKVFVPILSIRQKGLSQSDNFEDKKNEGKLPSDHQKN